MYLQQAMQLLWRAVTAPRRAVTLIGPAEQQGLHVVGKISYSKKGLKRKTLTVAEMPP